MVRLYIPHIEPSSFTIDKDHSHYLKNVLRLSNGDILHVFNKEGEWRAQILDIKKSQATLMMLEKVKEPYSLPFVGLAFAPLKHDAQHLLLEKATELGVTDLYPITTQRSNIHRIAKDKWIKNTIEATQQCERLTPPTIHSLCSLDHFMTTLPSETLLFVGKERGEALPIAKALLHISPDTKCIFLIGPEGGFTNEEIMALSKKNNVHLISLGPRILRAETAALATLVCFQSLLGDWQE